MSLEETLTSRQLEVLNAIKDHMEKTGSAPSTGELAQSLGIARSSIPGHLEALEKKRALEKVGKRYRVTELFSDDYFVLRSSIAAGIPTESVDDVEGEPLKFDRGYFGGGEIEPVRICGESMCGDSIHDGDIAMIRLGKDFAKQDIVAVRVGGETTLKRVRRLKNSVELIPSNPSMETMKFESHDVEIVGTFVGLVRRA